MTCSLRVNLEVSRFSLTILKHADWNRTNNRIACCKKCEPKLRTHKTRTIRPSHRGLHYSEEQIVPFVDVWIPNLVPTGGSRVLQCYFSVCKLRRTAPRTLLAVFWSELFSFDIFCSATIANPVEPPLPSLLQTSYMPRLQRLLGSQSHSTWSKRKILRRWSSVLLCSLKWSLSFAKHRVLQSVPMIALLDQGSTSDLLEAKMIVSLHSWREWNN